jgi:hypothetical protein
MTTFTEFVAAVVVQSSTVALSHFGVGMEPPQVERPAPPVQRVVARTPQPPVKLTSCPRPPHPARALKA